MVLLASMSGCIDAETGTAPGDDIPGEDSPDILHPKFSQSFACSQALHTSVRVDGDNANSILPGGWSTPESTGTDFATYEVNYVECPDLTLVKFLFAFIDDHPDDVGHLADIIYLVWEVYVSDLEHPYAQALLDRGGRVYQGSADLQTDAANNTVVTLTSERGAWEHIHTIATYEHVQPASNATGYPLVEQVFLRDDDSYFSTLLNNTYLIRGGSPFVGIHETTGDVFRVEPDYGTNPIYFHGRGFNVTLPESAS